MLDRRRFMITGTLALAAGSVHASASGSAQETAVRVSGETLGKLPAYGLGFSMEKHLIGLQEFFVPSNTSFAGCCRRLGPNVLRLGGDHVDHTGWAANGPGGVNGVTSPRDIEVFAQFVRSIGWKVIYGLNLAHSTPADAAAEAVVAAKFLGPSLLAFEIGNEPDLYAFHGIRSQGYDYGQFLNEWRPVARAVIAAVPAASLSGPGAYNAWRKYTLPFAQDEHNSIRMLTQHYYRANGRKPGATVDALFGGLNPLFDEMQHLVEAARQAGIADGFRMVETNSFVGGGSPGVSDAMASALWALDYILRAAELGVNGINFQIGPASHSNTSLAIGKGQITDVRPQFYALALAAALGTGTMLRTEISGGGAGLSAFALRDREGGASIILNNKDADASARIAVTTGTAATQGRLVRLSAAGLMAKEGVTLGGAAIAPDGSGEPAPQTIHASGKGIFTLDLPAASAAWLHVRTT